MPDQDGKRVIVTGGNSGIGLEAAKALAAKGALVTLAVCNTAKGQEAANHIRSAYPNAHVAVEELNLASLANIRAFAERWGTPIDILINNAGVMAIPYRRTEDGFEMQLGTNFFGHFALTGLLLRWLLAAPRARVVTVSSGAHTFGTINFSDLDSTHRYNRWRAYGQSKLADLLFAYELQRRMDVASTSALSVACHPGFAATNLQVAGPQMDGSNVGVRLAGAFNVFGQSAAMGALPTLYAATAPGVDGGEYIGPNGVLEMRGYPTRVQSNARSHDADVARRLWQVAEDRTGVHYDALQAVNG